MNSVSASPDWTFEPSGPMGGAAGEAFINPLTGSGMPRAAVLAREAIQNSVDAGVKGSKVLVQFRESKISGADKVNFCQASNLIQIFARKKSILPNQPNCSDQLNDDHAELNLLFIEDYNTTGLEGDFNNPLSKYFRFLLSLGDGGKIREAIGTGGSFGFGKSVYSSNSAINTIFAYSKTRDQNGNVRSIIMGCGYFRSHEIGEKFFTGRAWFGINVTKNDNFHPKVEPLICEQADQLAVNLGFKIRGDNDLGTSVLIIDSSIDIKDLAAGVEDWWWPRIISNDLDVQIIQSDNSKIIPRPRMRAHLKPFIEAFELATNQATPKNGIEYSKSFNRIDGKNIGSCALKVLEKDEDGNFALDEERVDAVALMRTPLMVVSYLRNWNVGNPAIAGVFLADQDIDDILRLSESPAHDKWDTGSARLIDGNGTNQEIVSSVLRRIKNEVKAFQRSATPPPPPRPRKLLFLEKTLANFLSPSRLGPSPNPEQSSAPIHLTYEKFPQLQATRDGQLIMSTKFGLKLKDEIETEELDIKLKVTCPVIADGQEVDPIDLTVTVEDSTLDSINDEQNVFRIKLMKNKTIKINAISAPYDPNWTIKFIPEVVPFGESK